MTRKITDKKNKKIGRPSSFTQKIADEICFELAQGKSLRTVCKSDDMPSGVTVFAWIRKYPDFLKQYTRAKEESADAMAEDILDISDNATNDYMDQNDPENPGYRINGEHIQRSRLRVESRKWLMSKQKPKKYGDKIQQDINLPEGVVFNMSFSNEDD